MCDNLVAFKHSFDFEGYGFEGVLFALPLDLVELDFDVFDLAETVVAEGLQELDLDATGRFVNNSFEHISQQMFLFRIRWVENSNR